MMTATAAGKGEVTGDEDFLVQTNQLLGFKGVSFISQLLVHLPAPKERGKHS